MATATKQVYYSPPQALLAKRRKGDGGRPTLTVAIPFSFSSRLERCDRRGVQSAASIRRSRTASLPRLPPPSARPSVTASTTDNSGGSLVKRAGSVCEASSLSGVDRPGAGEEGGEAVSAAVVAEECEEALSPEEELEKRLNHKKCLQWLEGLPNKFSGMHIVQQTVYTASNR